MATYVVEKDNYAGWEGSRFGLAGIVAGAVALLCWTALHHPGYGPRLGDPSDQLFLSAVVWIGGGVFVIMAIAVLGSIQASRQSRGTVTVDDEGVLRQIGKHTWSLRWAEIEGMVSMPGRGVTLIPTTASRRIVIPNSLGDYRACIAGLKAKGVRYLPSDRLYQSGARRKQTWWESVRLCVVYMGIWFAFDTRLPAKERVGGLCVAILMLLWLTLDDVRKKKAASFYWSGMAIVQSVVLWVAHAVRWRGCN